MPKEYAPGIPDKKKLSSIPTKSKPFITNYVIHSHAAERAGQHFDFRLNINNVAYSWAMRYFPDAPGEKRLGIRQPDHTIGYMAFSGIIKDGYGKGKVTIRESGVCKIKYCGHNRIHVILLSGQHPKDLFMKKTWGGNKWLVMNVTKKKSSNTPTGKAKLKDLTKKDISKYIKDEKYAFQPKIDGAHNILILPKDKPPQIISHRESKRSGTGIIDHTHRFPNLPLEPTPPELSGVYRGEVYATSKGRRLIPAEELGGLLNSKIEKSLSKQKKDDIKMRMALFGLPENKQKALVDFLGDTFEPIETEYKKEKKENLLEEIRQGLHKKTREGIVILNRETGETSKYRLRPDYDVYVRRMFPGAGKYEGNSVGGFHYSSTSRGPILGKVGTGFTDKQRKDMFKNPQKYLGRVATLEATRRTKSGALFQPSFIRMHLDK